MPDGRVQKTFDDIKFLKDFQASEHMLSIYIQQRDNQIIDGGLECQDAKDLETSEKALKDLGIDPDALYNALG